MNKIYFTEEQLQAICELIDEWYVLYKDVIVNYENKTHKLGYAKEILKVMITNENSNLLP